jgi:hypothetical protein
MRLAPATAIIRSEDLKWKATSSLNDPIWTTLATSASSMALINRLSRLQNFTPQALRTLSNSVVDIDLLANLSAFWNSHILQTFTSQLLALAIILTIAAGAKLLIGAGDTFAEDGILDKSEVSWDFDVVDCVDYLDWVVFVGRECAKLAPMASLFFF